MSDEDRQARVARIKAEAAESAAREIKLQALREEMTRHGAFHPELADRLFADRLECIAVKGGCAYGATEIVAQFREQHPELFQGPNPSRVGGTPPRREPAGGRVNAIEAREQAERTRVAMRQLKRPPTFGGRIAKM